MPKVKLAPAHETFDINKLIVTRPDKKAHIESLQKDMTSLGEILVEKGVANGQNPSELAIKHLMNAQAILSLMKSGVEVTGTTKPGLGGLLKPRITRDSFEIACIWVIFQELFFGVKYDYEEFEMVPMDGRTDIPSLSEALEGLSDYDIYIDKQGREVPMGELISLIINTIDGTATAAAKAQFGRGDARKIDDNTPHGLYEHFASNVDVSKLKDSQPDLRAVKSALTLSIALDGHVNKILNFFASREYKKHREV